MATRFEIVQYPASGSVVYHLYIDDADFVGTPSQLNGYFSIPYQDVDDKDPLYPIIESSVDITVHVNQEDSDFESFLNELVGSDEMRFQVTIKRNTSLIWRGHLPTDLLEIPDEYYTYDVNLTASDGLARLKTIEYRDVSGNAFTGADTVAQHFVNLLRKIGFTYSEADPIICKTYAFKWVENSQASSIAVINNQRIQHSLFQAYSTYPDLICTNCYDVLSEILTACGARVMMSDGVFVIQQINEHYSTYMNIWKYDGTYLGFDTVDRRTTVTTNRSDGKFKFYPAVKEATSDFAYEYSLNKNNLLPSPMPKNTEVPIGDFSGSDNHFIMNLRIRSNFNLDLTGPAYALYKIGINVGTVSLSGRYSTFFGNLDMQWQSGIHWFYVFSPAGLDYSSNIVQFEIITPAFSESGAGKVYIDLVGLYADPNNAYAGSTTGFSYDILTFNMIQLQGNVAGQSGTLKYKAINMQSDGVTPINSSVVRDLGKNSIGDGPTSFSVSRMQVLNGSSVWVDSDLWIPNSAYAGTALPLHKMRLQEFIALNKSTVKLFEFTLEGYCRPYNTVYFEGEEYLILSYKLNPHFDNVEITCMRIAISRDYITILEAIQEEGSGGSSGGSSGGGFGNPAQDSHVRKHSMVSNLDHAPADTPNFGKLVATNATTGAIEYITKLIQYWQRNGSAPYAVSPLNTGDNIDSATGYLIGALKATKIIAKANGTTAIQITKANGTTVVMNLDTTNDLIKMYSWLCLSIGGDFAPKSVLDIYGSMGMAGRKYIAPSGGGSFNMQDTESIYLVNCTSGNVTMNLQAASLVPRRICHIKYLAGGNTLTIQPSGTDAIYSHVGYGTITMNTPGHWITIQSYLTSGTTWDWYIISAYPIK